MARPAARCHRGNGGRVKSGGNLGSRACLQSLRSVLSAAYLLGVVVVQVMKKAVVMNRSKARGSRFVLTELDPLESLATEPEHTYVTAKEAAKIAGVGVRYIYVMLREERVKALWIGTRRVNGQMKGGRCFFNLASVKAADVCRSHCAPRRQKSAAV